MDENDKGNLLVSSSEETEKSSVFSRQLAINTGETSKSSCGLDIRQLALQVDRARKKPRVDNKSGYSVSFLSNAGQKNDNSENQNVIQSLNHIREKSKQLRRNNRLPSSTTKPNDINISNENTLLQNLHQIVETSRMKTTYAIMKDKVDVTNNAEIGIVKNVSKISDSLKIIKVSQPDSSESTVGLVSLWNEWIEINVNDRILFLDIELNTNHREIQWSFEWKKLIK